MGDSAGDDITDEAGMDGAELNRSDGVDNRVDAADRDGPSDGNRGGWEHLSMSPKRSR